MSSDKFRVSIHRHYYCIAVEQRRVYSELDAGMSQAKTVQVSDDEVDAALEKAAGAYEKREQAAVIGITFATMCIEAFFYDYAASRLGDGFTEAHLDKLDLPSKLLIIPQLVCGKAIEKSSHIFEKVKRLTRDRNYLVHFKSHGFDLHEMDKASEFHDELNERFRQALTNGVEAVEIVLRALDDLHGTPDYYFNRVCQ
ncbi:MAG: hypothetical protein Q8S00_01665 [Deltaproteobacteria bacterium]|nr:hypothetical protein [Deltaproteobacteria bacterium]